MQLYKTASFIKRFAEKPNWTVFIADFVGLAMVETIKFLQILLRLDDSH
jgi:hypothetical protein